MRIRILKDISSPPRNYRAGEVIRLPKNIAEQWIKQGKAMLDKTIDGGRESKAAQGRAEVARQPHTLEVAGSIPTPATKSLAELVAEFPDEPPKIKRVMRVRMNRSGIEMEVSYDTGRSWCEAGLAREIKSFTEVEP
jgi:hypothetical protein